MSWLGDAWDWTKGAVSDVGGALWDGVKSTVGGQASFRPSAPKLDQTVANADRRASLQARANQTYLNRSLQDQIEGKGPSVAELQQRQGVAQAMQNAGRQAANARGVSRGLAQRESLYAGLNAQSQAARDATLLRAQEQLSAQQQFGSNVAQQRQQDLTNRALSLQAAQGDVNAITQQQAQQTLLAQGNAERAQKGFGAGAALLAPIAGALLSDVRAKSDIEPSPVSGAAKRPTDWGEVLNKGLSAMGQGLMGQPVQMAPPAQSPVPASMAQSGQSASLVPSSDSGNSLQAGLSAMGQGLMLSDERAKESAVNLAPLEPYRYRYRPEFAAALAESAAAKAPPSVSDVIRGEAYADARALRDGVMAQDLERSPEGKKAVIKSKSGLRAIDEKRALSFALGQMAGLNKRLERLEGGAQ